MKLKKWLFAVVVLALSYSIMFRQKRLDARWVALGNRHHVVENLVHNIRGIGAGICNQVLDEILPSQYKSGACDYKLLSQSSGDYCLVVHEKGCVSFFRTPFTSGAFLPDRIYHLGNMVVEETSDSQTERYIIGFECGQAFYVDGKTKDAIENGKDCVCVMVPDIRCWRMLNHYSARSGRLSNSGCSCLLLLNSTLENLEQSAKLQ